MPVILKQLVSSFQATICETVLTSNAFMGCNALLEVQEYVDACVQDLCKCDASAIDICVCDTFAEYSRQCAHAGGQPLEWRTADLCRKFASKEHLPFWGGSPGIKFIES